jgi:phage-related protein
LIDKAIVQGIKNCTDSLQLIYDSVKNLTDPKQYDLFVTAHDLVIGFENVIDGIFNDTIGVLQEVQREVSSIISSPIEIIKHSFESMASRNLDDSFTYMEDQIASLREALEQVRAPILDETGYLQFTYTYNDLNALVEMNERAVNMKEAMLDDVRDVLTHFADSISKPINKLVDQILESILKFFGGKQSALFSLLEKKVHDIINNFTVEQLSDLLGDTYDLLKNSVKSMEKRINSEMDDIIFYLNETESVILAQGTLVNGLESSLNIYNIIDN